MFVVVCVCFIVGETVSASEREGERATARLLLHTERVKMADLDAVNLGLDETERDIAEALENSYDTRSEASGDGDADEPDADEADGSHPSISSVSSAESDSVGTDLEEENNDDDGDGGASGKKKKGDAKPTPKQENGAAKGKETTKKKTKKAAADKTDGDNAKEEEEEEDDDLGRFVLRVQQIAGVVQQLALLQAVHHPPWTDDNFRRNRAHLHVGQDGGNGVRGVRALVVMKHPTVHHHQALQLVRRRVGVAVHENRYTREQVGLLFAYVCRAVPKLVLQFGDFGIHIIALLREVSVVWSDTQ